MFDGLIPDISVPNLGNPSIGIPSIPKVDCNNVLRCDKD